MVGPESRIRSVAATAGIDLDGFVIHDAQGPEIAAKAVAQVRSGGARALMKGQIPTPDLMKAVLDPANGLRTGRVICQVVLMEIPRDGRRFLMADTGICVQPSLDDRIDILGSTVELARMLGATKPKVALMAATETVKPSMPETVEWRRADPSRPARRVWRLRGRRPAFIRPGLCRRRRRQEARRERGRRRGRHHALPQPALGQPDGQGDHVHGGLRVSAESCAARRHRSSSCPGPIRPKPGSTRLP